MSLKVYLTQINILHAEILLNGNFSLIYRYLIGWNGQIGFEVKLVMQRIRIKFRNIQLFDSQIIGSFDLYRIKCDIWWNNWIHGNQWKLAYESYYLRWIKGKINGNVLWWNRYCYLFFLFWFICNVLVNLHCSFFVCCCIELHALHCTLHYFFLFIYWQDKIYV